MSAGQELMAVAEWLYARLTADATLGGLVGTRVYADLAPESAAFPMVVFQFQTGEDVDAAGGIRVLANTEWLIRGIDMTPSYRGALGSVAARVDSLLHAASGTATSGTVIACVRTRPFQMASVTDGVQYRHAGGFYKVIAQ